MWSAWFSVLIDKQPEMYVCLYAYVFMYVLALFVEKVWKQQKSSSDRPT